MRPDRAGDRAGAGIFGVFLFRRRDDREHPAAGPHGAALGVAPRDSGVASAMVSTSQQIGGSIGTALLSTLAVSATTDFLIDRGPGPEILRRAAVEGYVTAFWWAAGIFALGALVTAGLLRSGVRPAPIHAAPEPALA